MRVTHIITRLIVGGAQENTIATVRGLRERFSLDAELLAGPTLGPEGSLEPEISQIPGFLTIVPALVRPVAPFRDAQALVRLTRLLRERRPAIVHTHSGKAGILGRLAARRAGVPVIVHSIHGPSFGPFQPAVANAAFVAAERFAARCTTHFISVCQAMTDQYLAAGIGSPRQFTRIYSGFHLEPFLDATNSSSFRASLGIAPDDLVVGKVARLFKLKGHDDLLDIAPALLRDFSKLKFLFVGDGKWRERLQQRAAQAGIADRVIFTGLVPPAEMPKFFGVMDVVVHLSRREGLARALTQGLAAGRPVIAYDRDGAREVCLDRRTGFLVAPGNLDGLLERFRELLADPALRQRFGAEGQTLVKASFSLEQMVAQIHALYVQLLPRAIPV